MALVLAMPSTAAGQVESGVYRWSALTIEPGPGADVRPILAGRTADLAELSVRAVTLPPSGSAKAGATPRDVEMLVIVKEGRLRVTIPQGSSAVGPGSVAVVMPGDPCQLENAGAGPVTFYEFVYRSKMPADADRARGAGGSFTVDWNDLEYRPTETGGRRQPFDRATAMFGRFEMHVTTLNPGLATHPPHTHRAEEMVLMIRGNATMTIDGRRVAASDGDLIFLGSQVPHALDNTGNGPAEYFAFQWEP
jgi:(S)-ureidoglycine aminohydrolase